MSQSCQGLAVLQHELAGFTTDIDGRNGCDAKHGGFKHPSSGSRQITCWQAESYNPNASLTMCIVSSALTRAILAPSAATESRYLPSSADNSS
jgi:hypothetical protein